MLRNFLSDSLFDEYFMPFEREFFGKGFGRHSTGLMKTDVRETENRLEADIDLPGFQKEDIQVDLKNGYLTVSAVQKQEKNEQDEKGRYLRQERYAGTVSRSYYVGEGVAPEDIQAKYENGILTLSLPKALPEAVEQKSRIQIEG